MSEQDFQSLFENESRSKTVALGGIRFHLYTKVIDGDEIFVDVVAEELTGDKRTGNAYFYLREEFSDEEWQGNTTQEAN